MNEYQKIYYAWLDTLKIQVVAGFEFNEECTEWANQEDDK